MRSSSTAAYVRTDQHDGISRYTAGVVAALAAGIR